MPQDPAGNVAVIVRSGGWAAKCLSEAGFRVAVLEAGRALAAADFKKACAAVPTALSRKDEGATRVRAAATGGIVHGHSIPTWSMRSFRSFDCVSRRNECVMRRDVSTSAAEMLEAIGARKVTPQPGARGLADEVGAARVGDNRWTSVLNPFQQAHDVPNLFVMDGSGFPSSGWQNPTLTLMALAVRTCDYIKESCRAGAL